MDTNDRAQDYPENFKLFEIKRKKTFVNLGEEKFQPKHRQQIEKGRKKNLLFFFKSEELHGDSSADY